MADHARILFHLAVQLRNRYFKTWEIFVQGGMLQVEQGIYLGSTDEIIFRQAGQCMGRVFHAALVEAQVDVGMMVFAVGNPGHCIHECHGLVVVFEAVSFCD